MATGAVPVSSGGSPGASSILMGSWFFDNGSNRLVYEKMSTPSDWKINWDDATIWEDNAHASRYLNPEYSWYFDGVVPFYNSAWPVGRASVVLPPGHSYHLSMTIQWPSYNPPADFNLPEPDLHPTEDISYVGSGMEVWMEPWYPTWQVQNGFYRNQYLKVPLSPPQSGFGVYAGYGAAVASMSDTNASSIEWTFCTPSADVEPDGRILTMLASGQVDAGSDVSDFMFTTKFLGVHVWDTGETP